VLLRPTRVYPTAWAANIPVLCMRQERFVLLARRLGRYYHSRRMEVADQVGGGDLLAR